MNLSKHIPTPWSQPKEDKITLGTLSGNPFRKEQLTQGQLNHHVHIVGASGFGKTVLLSHIVKDRIQKGHGMLFIDLKGDIDTIEKFRGYATAENRENDLMMFNLSDQANSTPYNLIQDGTPTHFAIK